MEKEYAKDYPIPFHNDVFFKYMLIGDDVGSALLRSRIIEEIYGLKVHETKVLNPELRPEAFLFFYKFPCYPLHGESVHSGLTVPSICSESKSHGPITG